MRPVSLRQAAQYLQQMVRLNRRSDSMKEVAWFAVIAGAVAIEALTAPGAGVSGQQWKLSRSDAPGMVRFTMERSRPGSRSVSSSDVPLSRFRGFSAGMLGHSGPARFEYVEDAGRFTCEGRYAWGRGAGSFTLAANPEFTAGLNRLGYATPHEDEIFSMMLADVSLEFARAIQEAGIGASLDELIELRMHGVTAEFIGDASRAGYRNFHALDYIDLRAHGVDIGFLRDMKSAGYDLRAQDLIDLRMHGVRSQFADDLKDAGYNLSVQQMDELAMHGVNSGFLRDLRIYGLRPPASELVQLRMHGVTPQYLRGLRDAGYPGLPAEAVIELRQHGVPSDFAGQAHELGYGFSTRELIDLHTHGVDAGYLKTLRDSGLRNLTEAQITQLRMHGVN